MTATDAGRRTCATAATAAIRSRSSNAATASASSDAGQLEVQLAAARRVTSTGKPESRKTCAIR